MASTILIILALMIFIWSNPPPRIGIFYYAWYDALASDWQPSKFVDFPVVGNYSSQNSTVIRQQLELIKNAEIDFVVVSWWGHNPSDSYQTFIDQATTEVFNTAKQMQDEGTLGGLKIAIMVENYDASGAQYDYTDVYSYINQNYSAKYPTIYLHENRKPLICFFYDAAAEPNLVEGIAGHVDANFSNVFVGAGQNWTYTNLNDEEPKGRGISVAPRFDDSRLNRSKATIIDADLTQGTYAQQWRHATELRKAGKIDTIMITSWNEYPERTAIEPQNDTTATNRDPYYLYNQTKEFINQIRK